MVIDEPVQGFPRIVQEYIQDIGLGITLGVFQPGLAHGRLIHVVLAVIVFLLEAGRVDGHGPGGYRGGPAVLASLVDGQDIDIVGIKLVEDLHGPHGSRGAGTTHSHHQDARVDGLRHAGLFLRDGLEGLEGLGGIGAGRLHGLGQGFQDTLPDGDAGHGGPGNYINIGRLVFQHPWDHLVDDRLQDGRGLPVVPGYLDVHDGILIHGNLHFHLFCGIKALAVAGVGSRSHEGFFLGRLSFPTAATTGGYKHQYQAEQQTQCPFQETPPSLK